MPPSDYFLEMYVGDTDPTTADVQISEHLARLTSLGLDPSLAEAYASSPQLYMYPGMTPDFSNALISSKVWDLEDLVSSYEFVYSNQLVSDEAQNEPRTVRRKIEQSKGKRPRGVEFIKGYLADEASRRLMEGIYTTQQWGTGRSDAVRLQEGANRLHYYYEGDPESDNLVKGFDFYEPFVEYVFSEGVPDDTKEHQVVDELRRRGVVDLSKDLLDARYNDYIATVQIVAAMQFLDDLPTLNNMGSSRRQALELAGKYKDSVLADDYTSKIQMSLDLERAFSNAARREPHKEASKFLKAYAQRSSSTAAQLINSRNGFRDTYIHLGYDLPSALQDIRTAEEVSWARQEPAQVVGRTAVRRAVLQSPSEKSTEDRELEALVADIIDGIQAAEYPYKYTSDRIRAFEDGTKLVRDLHGELVRRQLNGDESLIQTLGILIGQSQSGAIDKTAYFVELLDAQAKIEGLLRDLNELGAGKAYHSSLINTLRWLDEMVESGTDTLVRNRRLRMLLSDYGVGPDFEMPVEPATVQVPVAPEPPLQTIEVPISDRSLYGVERTKLMADRKRAQEIYGDTISLILETEEIEFIDVVATAAGPGKLRTHPATGERQVGALYADIDDNRVLGLLELRNRLRAQGKDARLQFIRGAHAQKYPPFVLSVRQNDEAGGMICILENPVVGYSSRLYAVSGDLKADPRDILPLEFKELSELGVIIQTKVHKPKGSPIFDQHYNLDLMNMINLHLNDL